MLNAIDYHIHWLVIESLGIEVTPRVESALRCGELDGIISPSVRGVNTITQFKLAMRHNYQTTIKAIEDGADVVSWRRAGDEKNPYCCFRAVEDYLKIFPE